MEFYTTKEAKAKLSRAYGRDYIVFAADGSDYATIRGRLLDHAMDDARECKGEIWFKGRCVVPSWNVK